MTDVAADGVVSGSSSDVRASVRLSRRVNGVIVDINGEEKTSLGLRLGSSSDVEVSDPGARARAGISQTLALRKVLGSGSDVTGRARWWIRFMGECMIEFEVKAEIWVKSKMKVKCQILAPVLGLALVILALRKELGSGSDVTGKSMHMIRIRREFGFNSDSYVIDKGYGVYRDTFRFASYSDVRAKARLIFIIVVCIGDINADAEGTDVEVDYVSSGDINADAEGPG
ncbi:Caspase-10 [Manis pentadactyla]|nr:Caspase-10 [Manis pentadactyla]